MAKLQKEIPTQLIEDAGYHFEKHAKKFVERVGIATTESIFQEVVDLEAHKPKVAVKTTAVYEKITKVLQEKGKIKTGLAGEALGEVHERISKEQEWEPRSRLGKFAKRAFDKVADTYEKVIKNDKTLKVMNIAYGAALLLRPTLYAFSEESQDQDTLTFHDNKPLKKELNVEPPQVHHIHPIAPEAAKRMGQSTKQPETVQTIATTDDFDLRRLKQTEHNTGLPDVLTEKISGENTSEDLMPTLSKGKLSSSTTETFLERNDTTYVSQRFAGECGPASIAMAIKSYLPETSDVESLMKNITQDFVDNSWIEYTEDGGVDKDNYPQLWELKMYAQSLGFKSETAANMADLENLQNYFSNPKALPFIALLNGNYTAENLNHFAVVDGIRTIGGKTFVVMRDPYRPRTVGLFPGMQADGNKLLVPLNMFQEATSTGYEPGQAVLIKTPFEEESSTSTN